MQAIAQGTVIPDDLLGSMRDSTAFAQDGDELRARLAEDGYVLLRGLLDRGEVLSAREEVFRRLHGVGEVKNPACDGIYTGTSLRRQSVGDLGQFWQSVSEGPALRRVSHGERIRKIMDLIYGEPTRPHDYIFLRPGVPGRSTHLHYDLPFFARGSHRIHTVWTALGDIRFEEGPLMILEGSNRFTDLLEPIRAVDYDSGDSPQVQMTNDTVEFARRRGARLLTTNFAAGDLVVFSMQIMHGTIDNHSPQNRIRLSCDVRWQPAADPVDPRYFGPAPAGTTGAGYGELNGAKPLTEPWHIR